MTQSVVQVDAFTDKLFAGNPAAVCILPIPADETWMKNVASEMNLSETAFLYKQDDGFNLRWFTPATEVDLCGHATLAAAHVLWKDGHLSPDEQARFFTKSGLLTAQLDSDWIEMDFPTEPESEASPPTNLAEALGVTPKYVGKNRIDYLVEVSLEQTVKTMRPNLALLKTIPCRGIIVTSQAASPKFDFISRFFAPQAGIDEDPVTGSAHCCLGPFWRTRLGKANFTAYQASPRGGVVRVRVEGDRVKLGGQAVTVLRGELV